MRGGEVLPSYSVGEEIAHSVTHGIGVVFSIAGLAVLTAFAAVKGTAWHIVACSIYGATLVLAYTASTIYHAIPAALATTKKVLRILDHSAIYLLIAGTYTPFALVNLRGKWGWSLLAVVWTLAVLGIVFKATLMGRLRVLSVFFYLLLGWLVVVAAKPLGQSVAAGGLALLVGGGIAYTAGVAFYAWRRLPYHHAIWHGFVLTGSVLHYFAILFYVVPLAD
ncbi:MAG: hemolysin III family protein [Thermoanaerobaculaceae bacterium]|nr:hemolysin III family protein [Thermoanaerobaculaceae bacterium]